MPYRETVEKKSMERRIVLTRGEVAKIVQQHLAASGLLPSLDIPVSVAMVALHDHPNRGLGYERPPDGAPWADWPAVSANWQEEVPAVPLVKP